MILHLDTMKTTLELEESEAGVMIREVGPTKYTTGEVMKRLASIYSANFEQDVRDAIKDLEETDDNGN